jgi:hypothetical protein
VVSATKEWKTYASTVSAGSRTKEW